jgi:hypothetical protein
MCGQPPPSVPNEGMRPWPTEDVVSARRRPNLPCAFSNARNPLPAASLVPDRARTTRPLLAHNSRPSDIHGAIVAVDPIFPS